MRHKMRHAHNHLIIHKSRTEIKRNLKNPRSENQINPRSKHIHHLLQLIQPPWPAEPVSNPPSHHGRPVIGVVAAAAAATDPAHPVAELAQPIPPPLTTPSLPLLPSFSIWFPSFPAPPPPMPSIIVVPLLCLHHRHRPPTPS
ncbi:hypothetical protein Dimus_021826 [Dionaea muscipula]